MSDALNDPLTPEQEEWVMDLAEKHNLGRRIGQIGSLRGVAPDVFYTDAGYRTYELFLFAAELLSAAPTPEATQPTQAEAPGDDDPLIEQSLAALIDLICPDLDSGDIVHDAREAMRELNKRAALAAQPPASQGEREALGMLGAVEDFLTRSGHTEPARQLRLAKATLGAALATQQADDALTEVLQQRDDAEDYIDAVLDEVLGADRPEWSSAYGRSHALRQVRETMAQQAEQGEPVLPTDGWSIDIRLSEDETRLLVDTAGGAEEDEPSPLRLLIGEGHEGFGLYVCLDEYPEEGSIFLRSVELPDATPPATGQVDESKWVALTKLRAQVGALRKDENKGDAAFRCGFNGAVMSVLGLIDAARSSEGGAT